MCAVEVEKMPKLQTACSTPAGDGMIVHTRSEKAKKNQKAIMEFLLINHPLDCPICDKAGECDLQDNSFKYGDAYMRTTEERRTYVDLDMGPVIKKNMNRCIHCTRCIRFGEQVAGIHEMVAIQRGNNTEISTINGRPLETDYAGNYADICPTGSLTLKDFRFKKRSWFLKKTPSICEGCSRGCNIEIQSENNVVYRNIPRTNLEINKYWMCDEGRFNFHYVNDPDRVVSPMVMGKSAGWSETLSAVAAAVADKKVLVLVGSDLTQEELRLIQEASAQLMPKAKIQHFGTPGTTQGSQDADADKILKRKSKTSNLHGVEKLGISEFSGAADAQIAVVFRGGRAVVPQLGRMPIVGVGVFMKQQAESFLATLPGAAFVEKDGTIVNFQGREQKFKRAVNPPGLSKLLGEIFMLWKNSRGSKAS
jgi:NADH-quinone oxidoreductase subunit G